MSAVKTARALAMVLVIGSGCGSRMVKLDAKKVRSVRVVLADRGDTYCHADLLPEVVAVVEYTDGRVLETWSPANPAGKLHAHDLEWTADVGTVEDNGVMTMPLDLLAWHDRVFAVRARVPTRPELSGEVRVTPRFDCKVVADVSGLDGYAGGSGADGSAGGAGPRVEVALAYVNTKLNGRLVLVRVRESRPRPVGVLPRRSSRRATSGDRGRRWRRRKRRQRQQRQRRQERDTGRGRCQRRHVPERSGRAGRHQRAGWR